jgi:fructose-1-phosphate kinase PfkB-like protein
VILAVCLNPAAGGKGVNVARVVRQLGEPVLLTGFLGGPTGPGDALAAALAGGLARRASWPELLAGRLRAGVRVEPV